MATRESNVIMFPQRIDPECKEDFRIAEQFLEKIDGPPHSRPAHLPQPDIAKTATAERLFERTVDEIDAETLAAHQLCRGGVLRDLGAKRANPAALFHHLAPPQHGLALGESQSD